VGRSIVFCDNSYKQLDGLIKKNSMIRLKLWFHWIIATCKERTKRSYQFWIIQIYYTQAMVVVVQSARDPLTK
jgi:hypothetical protein